MAALKKRVENLFKTIIENELTAQTLTCTVINGHAQGDTPDFPYLCVVCTGTPSHPDFPTNSGVKQASLQILLYQDIDSGTDESDYDSFYEAAKCALIADAALGKIQTETQANYTDIHVHAVKSSDEGTDDDGECVRVDIQEFEIDLEYIDAP